MHHHTELSFVDEFRWVSPLHYLKTGWQNAVLRWCMLQAGPPFLHHYCAVILHSCILLTHVGHSSDHENHCCQLTKKSNCVSNFIALLNFSFDSPRSYTIIQILLCLLLDIHKTDCIYGLRNIKYSFWQKGLQYIFKILKLNISQLLPVLEFEIIFTLYQKSSVITHTFAITQLMKTANTQLCDSLSKPQHVHICFLFTWE
jgi:hypothetical protein